MYDVPGTKVQVQANTANEAPRFWELKDRLHRSIEESEKLLTVVEMKLTTISAKPFPKKEGWPVKDPIENTADTMDDLSNLVTRCEWMTNRIESITLHLETLVG